MGKELRSTAHTVDAAGLRKALGYKDDVQLQDKIETEHGAYVKEGTLWRWHCFE